MSNEPRSPGLRDFDYFSDATQVATPERLAEMDDLPDGLEAQVDALRARGRRYRRAALLSAAFFGVSTWFVWGFRSEIAYAFSPSQPPKIMGDVTAIEPGALHHNAYVQVSGITEHRGLRQKTVRGLGVVRQERWYMRLLGSRGVFVELDPNPDKYGFATAITVAGRVVAVERDAGYQALFEAYQDRFFAKETHVVRVIQAGVAPGQGRLPYVLLFSLLGLVAGVNLWTLRQWTRLARQKPLVGFRPSSP